MATRRVMLELGGQERELRFGLGAWAALEDHGVTIDDVFAQVEQRMPFRTVQRLLWAMLQTENGQSPTMTDVGQWVDLRNFEAVVAKAKEAIRDGMPEGSSTPPLGVGGSGAPPADSPLAPFSSPPSNSGA